MTNNTYNEDSQRLQNFVHVSKITKIALLSLTSRFKVVE